MSIALMEIILIGMLIAFFMCIRSIARSIIRWIRDIWMER